jgi:transcriptional regulator GlxA family with amidase domain
VSHEALVAQTRFAAAAVLLEQANGTILDVALSLGYSTTRTSRAPSGGADARRRSIE